MENKSGIRSRMTYYTNKEVLEAYLDFLGVDYDYLKEKAIEQIFSRYGYRIIDNKEVITPYVEEYISDIIVGYIKTTLNKDNDWIIKDIMTYFDFRTDDGQQFVEEYRRNLDPKLEENEIKIKKLQEFLKTWR